MGNMQYIFLMAGCISNVISHKYVCYLGHQNQWHSIHYCFSYQRGKQQGKIRYTKISCMRQSDDKNLFLWPQTPDVIFYFRKDVHAVILEPEPATSRFSKFTC